MSWSVRCRDGGSAVCRSTMTRARRASLPWGSRARWALVTFHSRCPACDLPKNETLRDTPAIALRCLLSTAKSKIPLRSRVCEVSSFAQSRAESTFQSCPGSMIGVAGWVR